MNFGSNFKSALVLLALALVTLYPSSACAWWNKDFQFRKKVTIDTSDKGVAITEPIGAAVILIRLHEGDFQFGSAAEDGSDICFVTEDDKTLLASQIEKFDSLLYEAYVWVKVPDLKPGEQKSFWLYYGNASGKEAPAGAKSAYDADTALVYHFAEAGSPPVDSSPAGNNAEGLATIVSSSIIGSGLVLGDHKLLTVPTSPSLGWNTGASVTWSAWIKPSALESAAVFFSRRDADRSLVIGMDLGVPFVAVTAGGATQRSSSGAAVEANSWHHVTVTSVGSLITLFLDGKSYGTLAVALPELKGPLLIGKTDAAGATAEFSGALDELQISSTAKPSGWVTLNAINQGSTEAAGKLVTLGSDEASAPGGKSELSEHLTLITDISKSLTFDGWVVIVLCTLLALVGWVVTINKFLYLNRITKATAAFLAQWKHIASDLTVLDHSDTSNIKSLGGKATSKAQKLMGNSPVYHIYQIGSEEIRHRLENARDGFSGLSGRSIQAIRATLDGGLVREMQKLNKNLVFLTIGIAGGPYLGLLGTVIGVMITFAVIAKSGEVEVNSIAPGIAGALLATVAGLAVAIPALFAYSYISSRIKDAISEMQIFIDEFVAKIAEFYPAKGE